MFYSDHFEVPSCVLFVILVFCFRSRLKKDYDDFRRQPDHDKFTRELWTTEEGEGDLGKESPKVEINKSVDSTEHLDTVEKDRFDSGRH